MREKGVVLLGKDKAIAERAKGRGLPIVFDPEMAIAFGKTLFVEPGTEVPWDLLPAAWHFLERWDAAVPLWRYGVNASDVGTDSERAMTQAVVRDLRVLLHAVELLFVKNNADGQALVAAYGEELLRGNERRLAFLRAMYRTKPRLCVLPRSWLARVFQRSKQDAKAMKGVRHTAAGLVTVEVAPGVMVKCHRGDEAAVKRMYAQRGRRRRHG